MNFKRWAPSWIFGIAAIFLFVWQQIQSVRLGYELEKTHKLIRMQQARNAYLQLEAERTLAPAEIARAARERLHMIPPTPATLIVLRHEPPISAPTVPANRVADRSDPSRWILAALPGGRGSELSTQ